MGFTGINDQNKQRISISPEAYRTIEHDVEEFKLKSINELVNITLGYNKNHNITQDSIIRDYESQMVSLLTASGIDPYKDDILERICDHKKAEICDELRRLGTHKRGKKGLYVRISNSMRRWLESPDNTEDEYYDGSLELYLNHMLEEYASKDLYSRETVIKDVLLSSLDSFIKDNEWIYIHYPDRTEKVYPYKVLPDIMRTHVYLACYILNADETKTPASRRVSFLPSDIERIPGYCPDVTSAEKARLDDLIKRRRIDFLTGEDIDIQIRMNKEALDNYYRTVRLRPDMINPEEMTDNNDIYTFHCTELQAQYYFSCISGDVEIIAPQSLRNRFREIHQRIADLNR